MPRKSAPLPEIKIVESELPVKRESNEFCETLRRSYSTKKVFAVTVPAESEKQIRSRIARGGYLEGVGVRTRTTYGTTNQGKKMVQIHFWAVDKTPRKPRTPKVKTESK